MATFVLISGAGGDPWYWHRVVPLLTSAGHEVLVVDLPGPDESAGLDEYCRLVLDAIDDRQEVVLVAQSLGGFTAPMVAARTPLRALVLVNAMIPLPGETPGDWWEHTGAPQARVDAAELAGYSTEFDEDVYFLHDVPAAVLATGTGPRVEADAVFASVCDIAGWPRVPTRLVTGVDDRFFPPGFQQRVARERLGADPDLLPGGHLIALSQPAALAAYLLSV